VTTISAIADLKAWVALDCPGASENLLLNALYDVEVEFFEKSEVWTEDILITTVADQAPYALASTETDALAQRILDVYYTDEDGNLSDEPEDRTHYYLDLTDRSLTWEQTWVPGDAGLTYTVRVSLVPENRASTYPAWVLNRFGRGIAAGASANILARPGPWQDGKGKWVGLERRRRNQFSDVWVTASGEAGKKGTRRARHISG